MIHTIHPKYHFPTRPIPHLCLLHSIHAYSLLIPISTLFASISLDDKHPFSILIDGVSGVADFQCRQLLGSRYFRLQPSIAGHGRIGLDAVSKIGRMRRIGESWPIEDALAWIDSHF